VQFGNGIGHFIDSVNAPPAAPIGHHAGNRTGVPTMQRSPDQIRTFLHHQVECWNAGRKDEMFALYHQIVPGKLRIEYIGIPPLEGWAALEDMWQRWAGKVHIELYRFDGDDLQIRYFHAAKL
jgi:hypothetical protein